MIGGVFIATPCYSGAVSTAYLRSALASVPLLEARSIDCDIETLDGCHDLALARCILAHHFLQTKREHLLFIDDDIEFEANAITSLLDRRKDVVAGSYVRRSLPIRAEHQLLTQPDATGLAQAEASGTGFMLIHRRVFELMRPHVGDFQLSGNGEVPDGPVMSRFFRFSLSRNQHLDEDMWFCRKWREIGGTIWVDTSVQLGHVGHFTFRP